MIPPNHNLKRQTTSGNSMIPPAKKEHHRELPWFIRPFVVQLLDVARDGHCGFRVAAHCLGIGKDRFLYVRQKLIEEIDFRRQFYLKEGTFLDFERDYQSLIVSSGAPCPPEKWMIMPTMAEPMENAFETPIFFFSERYSQTTFPCFCPPNNNPPIFIA